MGGWKFRPNIISYVEDFDAVFTKISKSLILIGSIVCGFINVCTVNTIIGSDPNLFINNKLYGHVRSASVLLQICESMNGNRSFTILRLYILQEYNHVISI